MVGTVRNINVSVAGCLGYDVLEGNRTIID